MTVYLVILHENGCDDSIAVHPTIESADADVEETKAQFPDMRWRKGVS